MIDEFLALMVRLVTGIRMESTWREDSRQRIFYANHSSHLDFIVIWAALPSFARKRVRPVAAAEYWERGKLRRWLANKVFRAVSIPRTRERMRQENPLESMQAALNEGSDLIIFPEGTRSATGEIGSFKSGLYHLALRSPDAELVPVFLENLNRILPKGEAVPVPLLGAIVFGPELEPPGSTETKPQFLLRAEKALLSLSRFESESK